MTQSRPAVDPKRLRRRMAETVQDQLEARGIHAPDVIAALNSVPRHLFVPEALRAHAYDDTPLPIGGGQTISQPFIVALMSAMLETGPGMRTLEIGTGSGYQAAVLAAMGCTVFTLERLPALHHNARALMRRLELRSVHPFLGDGTLGLPQAAPFDRIIVTAGGPEVPPSLLGQLADNGILLIPVGSRPRTQRLLRLSKTHGQIRSEDLGPVIFVDLVGSQGWRP